MAKKHKHKHQKSAVAETEPANGKLTRKEFEQELHKLQVELTRLQAWAVTERARVIVVFEGRDTAGKGGVIKRITERCSPRVFRHWRCPHPRTARRASSTSNATWPTSRPRAKS